MNDSLHNLLKNDNIVVLFCSNCNKERRSILLNTVHCGLADLKCLAYSQIYDILRSYLEKTSFIGSRAMSNASKVGLYAIRLHIFPIIPGASHDSAIFA